MPLVIVLEYVRARTWRCEYLLLMKIAGQPAACAFVSAGGTYSGIHVLHHHSATIDRSEGNDNTKGCKFEADLKALLTQGEQDDLKLVALEQKFMRGERYTDEEVQDASALAKTLKETIKSGTKIVQAMKPWFNI